MINALSYLLFLIILFSVSLIPKQAGKCCKSFFQHYYIILSLLFFIGLRGFIVTDWVQYYPFYRDYVPDLLHIYPKYWTTYNWERGFLLYCSIIKSLTNNFFTFQLISFAIDLLLINDFIKKNVEREYYAFAYACFFVFQGFVIETNLLRNSKAIVLFLYSISYIKEHKVKYLLINILGCFFHISAFLYVFAVFFLEKRINKRMILFLFIIGNIFFILHIKWISIFLGTLLNILGQSRLRSLIIGYGLLEKENSFHIGFGYIERLLYFLFVYTCHDKLLKKNQNFQIFLNMFYIYSFIYLYFSEFYLFVQRFPMLFIPAFWIIIPEIYSIIKGKNKKTMFLLFLVFYSCLKIFLQCDEPNYRYTNALVTEQNYEQSLQVIRENERKKGLD